MRELLDPKNDLVFKHLFVGAPHLLADLINAVRSDEAPIEVIEILNPYITPEDLSGKFIILDVLVRDTQGHLYNIEMQVRSLTEWLERSLYYLSSAYTGQLKGGQHYATLKPVIGINLLDFELFAGEQAHWRFRLRDANQPGVALDLLQLHVLELRKLDRQRGQTTDALAAWVAYFTHFREDSVMSEIQHPPVQQALDQLKQMSQEELWWRALAKEKAVHDEVTFLENAHRKGLAEGRTEGSATLLTRQLTLKFGDLPAPLQQRLQQASTAELELWAERILFADTLAAVFR